MILPTGVADYMHQLYENHSYFANDTREVVEVCIPTYIYLPIYKHEMDF